MTPEPNKRICPECRATMRESELLTAPNPFDPGCTITGCPKCFQPILPLVACEEPGCWEHATCGFRSGDGPYLRTCYAHYTHRGALT